MCNTGIPELYAGAADITGMFSVFHVPYYGNHAVVYSTVFESSYKCKPASVLAIVTIDP